MLNVLRILICRTRVCLKHALDKTDELREYNKKSSLPDLNRRPTHYECVALPTEPRKHFNLKNALENPKQLSMTCPGIEPGFTP